MPQPRVSHPVFARGYARLRPAMDAAGVDAHRSELLAGLTGRLVEVGAGDGANFPHYPEDVSAVLAVEPEREQIPAASGSFVAAVACLVLRSVTDPGAALRELRRVLRPGGQVRFFEHVGADTPALRRTQRILDATVWPFLTGGCHTGRDTVTLIEDARFRVDRLSRLPVPVARVTLPTTPHAFVRATRLP